MKIVFFGFIIVFVVVVGMMCIDDKDDVYIWLLYEVVCVFGINFFDYVDIYGGSMYYCEECFVDVL